LAGKTLPYIYIIAYVKHARGSEQHTNSGILFNVLFSALHATLSKTDVTMTQQCAARPTRAYRSNVIRPGCLYCQQQYIDRPWYALINDIAYYSTEMCNKCNVWAFKIYKNVCIDIM